MDTFTIVATIVVLAFVAWVIARNLGRGKHGRRGTNRSGSDGGAYVGATWSGGGNARRDVDQGDGGTDAGGDGGGGGD